MNEPSNFLDGSTVGCPSNSLENPPYTPGRRRQTETSSNVRAVHTPPHNLVLSSFFFQVCWEVCSDLKLYAPLHSRNCQRIITCTVSMDSWKLKPPLGLDFRYGVWKLPGSYAYTFSSPNLLFCVLFSALKRILAKRPFVISRSTFPSHGSYSGHWLGDNRSHWKDLYTSIAG